MYPMYNQGTKSIEGRRNSMKRIISVILSFVMIIALVACQGISEVSGNLPQRQSGDTIIDSGSGQSSSEVVSDSESGQNEIADTSATYSSIGEAAEALLSSITEDQKNTVLPEEYNEGVYTISEAGDYYFTGELTGGVTVNKNAGNVHIYLDGVTLSVEDDSAISSKKGAYVTITLIGENTLSNTLGSGAKDKNVLDSKENLVINGEGTLTINSTKSAISCDKTFIGLSGTINAIAVKHVVTADSVYLDEITVNAEYCGKDVLHAESDYDEVETAPEFSFGAGFVYIENATINTTEVYGDGIQADSYVYIKGGTFNITTTPTWNNSYVATENQENGMYSVSNHQKVSRDSVRRGSTYAVLEESVKGIKVGEIDYYLITDTEQANELTVTSEEYTILIEGGTFNINTVDDAIHTNSGSVFLYGGNLTINTSDDGIHADTNLKISGSAVINVESSYEGIEAETIDISGGTTTIIALDDGVNATNSNLTESQQKSVCQINISGGRLDVTVNPNGDRDGIDSNGGIKITGGVVITRGPNSQTASPMDSANTVYVSGGTVIVIGNAPGAGGQFSGGPGRMGGGPSGGGEGSWTVTNVTKTQSSSKGLSSGSHTVVIGGTTISYYNLYNYSGYTTVYSSGTATIN